MDVLLDEAIKKLWMSFMAIHHAVAHLVERLNEMGDQVRARAADRQAVSSER